MDLLRGLKKGSKKSSASSNPPPSDSGESVDMGPKPSFVSGVEQMKELLGSYEPETGKTSKPGLARPKTTQVSQQEVSRMKNILHQYKKRQILEEEDEEEEEMKDENPPVFAEMDEDEDIDWKEGWNIDDEVEVLRSGGNWDSGWKIYKITDEEITAVKQLEESEGALRKRYLKDQFLDEVRRVGEKRSVGASSSSSDRKKAKKAKKVGKVQIEKAQRAERVTQLAEVERMKQMLKGYDARQRAAYKARVEENSAKAADVEVKADNPADDGDDDSYEETPKSVQKSESLPARMASPQRTYNPRPVEAKVEVFSPSADKPLDRETLTEDQRDLYDLFLELNIDGKYLGGFFEEEITKQDIPNLRKKQIRTLIPKIGPQTRLMDYIYTNKPHPPKQESESLPSISSTMKIESPRAAFHFFSLFDRNFDGKIQLYELINGLREYGAEVKEKDVIPMIQAVDTDGDYELDFDEFQNLMTQRPDLLQFIKVNQSKIQSRVEQLQRPASSPFGIIGTPNIDESKQQETADGVDEQDGSASAEEMPSERRQQQQQQQEDYFAEDDEDEDDESEEEEMPQMKSRSASEPFIFIPTKRKKRSKQKTCDQCYCRRFIPDRWKPHICRLCRHSDKSHQRVMG